MKSRALSMILFISLMGLIVGKTMSVFPAEATGSAQQVWYINNARQLITNPNDNTMQYEFGILTIGTSLTVAPSQSVDMAAGFWHGRIALSKPYSGTGQICVGVMDSNDYFSNLGSMMLNSGPYQNMIEINLETDFFRISEGLRLAIEFRNLSDAMDILTGGSNSYFISPPGSQSFPDPDQNLTFDLTLTANGEGTTSPSASVNPSKYYENTVVPISATPSSGYRFTGWSGSILGTTNPTTVTMDSAKSVTANFVSNETKTNTSTSIVSDKSVSASGQSVIFTAEVSPASGLGTPTGNVFFYDGISLLGNGTSLGNAQWTYGTSLLSIGGHSITAQYAGDQTYNSSSSQLLTHEVIANYVNLILVPDTDIVVVGETFDVAIQLQSGSQSVVGVDAHLSFDPAVLAVVDSDPSLPGVQIADGGTLRNPIQNSTNNSNGQIHYCAGVLGGNGITYPHGAFLVATVRFRALSPTSTDTRVNFVTSSPNKTYVSGSTEGRDVTGVLTGGNCRVISEGEFDVSTKLQGVNRPETGWEIPLTVKFFTPGDNVMSATPVYSFTLISTEVNKSASIHCTRVQTGSYDITAESAHTLVNVKRNVNITESTTLVSLGTLLEGNASFDDRVSIADFSVLSGAYGKLLGDPDYDPNTDFDCDGEVNIADFSLLSGNYTRISPIELQ